jgi:hypothetical protein
MSNATNKTPSKFQTELQGLADGLSNSSSTLLSTMVVLSASLSKAEVIAKLRTFIGLFTAVTQARAALVGAIAARKAALLTMRGFYEGVVGNVKQVIGPGNLTALAAFGIVPPAQRKAPSPEVKAIAKAKAAATRKARGIMGKQARQAITVNPEPTLQITGAGLETTTMATPAPVSPTASPAGTTHTP